MTIYDIKEATSETSPYFFSDDTLGFFGQTMESFEVTKQGNKYLIEAPSGDNWTGDHMTRRLFNPKTNELERVKDE
jgi:hypothetical protein